MIIAGVAQRRLADIIIYAETRDDSALIMVLSAIADVSCKLFLLLLLSLPQHCNCNFEKNSFTAAGSVLVFWDEMFLGIFGFLVDFLEEIFQVLYQSYGGSS